MTKKENSKRGFNGTDHIKKLPSGKIFIQVYLGRKADGKVNRPGKSFDTEKEARKWAAEQKYLYNSKQIKSGGDIPFEVFANLWLEYKKSNVAPKTWDGYSSDVNSHMIPFFGDTAIKDITVKTVNMFITYLETKGLAKKTISSIKTSLHGLLAYAMAEDRISKNPVDCCRRIQATEMTTSKRRAIPKEVRDKIFAEAKALEDQEREYGHLYGRSFFLNVFLSIAYRTGMRPGEILALRWENIDLENGIIHVKEAMSETKDIMGDGKYKPIIGKTKTKNSVRDLAINDTLVAQLRELPRNPKTDFVIFSRNNTVIRESSISIPWRKILDKLDLKGEYVIYEFRHTHASMAALSGIAPAALKDEMGHSDSRTTDTYYVHSNMTERKKIAALFND